MSKKEADKAHGIRKRNNGTVSRAEKLNAIMKKLEDGVKDEEGVVRPPALMPATQGNGHR